MLPICGTFLIVHRDSSNFVLSSSISLVLGLNENTFLSALEQFCITVKWSWEPSSEILERLRSVDIGVDPSAEDVLILVTAVPGLMRAHLCIEGKTLDNEKNVLKAFLRINN